MDRETYRTIIRELAEESRAEYPLIIAFGDYFAHGWKVVIGPTATQGMCSVLVVENDDETPQTFACQYPDDGDMLAEHLGIYLAWQECGMTWRELHAMFPDITDRAQRVQE